MCFVCPTYKLVSGQAKSISHVYICFTGSLRQTVANIFQIDLRDDPKTIAKLNNMKEKPIATEQGQKLAKEVRIDQLMREKQLCLVLLSQNGADGLC